MKTLDKEKHYTKGRDIEPITGIVYDISLSKEYQNRVSRLAAQKYLFDRFKELYKDEIKDEHEIVGKIYELSQELEMRIIAYTEQGFTLDQIACMKDMPNKKDLREIIINNGVFYDSYMQACAKGSVFLVDDLESIAKDFISGNAAEHIDAVGLNSIVKSVATIARMKNPERYGENVKNITNHNTQINNNYGANEIKMVAFAFIEQANIKDLEEFIAKSRDRIDYLVQEEINKQ
jgi:hypothetical protein